MTDLRNRDGITSTHAARWAHRQRLRNQFAVCYQTNVLSFGHVELPQRIGEPQLAVTDRLQPVVRTLILKQRRVRDIPTIPTERTTDFQLHVAIGSQLGCNDLSVPQCRNTYLDHAFVPSVFTQERSATH